MTEFAQALATLGRSKQLISEVVSQVQSPRDRGTKLSEMLRAQCPWAGLCSCVLRENGQSCGCALDGTGLSRTDWADALIETYGKGRPAAGFVPPAQIALADHAWAAEWIGSDERGLGLMALALPESLATEVRSVVQAFLNCCAVQLALLLQVEALERANRRYAEEVAELTWLANIGDLVGPIIHEFNNFLNVSLLNVTLLERQLDPSHRPDLSSIRGQGADAAALIRQLQQHRQRNRPRPQAIDLNQVVNKLFPGVGRVRVVTSAGVALVRFEPAAGLPRVTISETDLKRLLLFLLTNSTAAGAGSTEVRIATGLGAEGAWLRVEDSGPEVDAGLLANLFDSHSRSREGTDPLELAACQSIVRRMHGAIRAENLDGGGLAVVIEFPAKAIGS